MLAGLFLLFTMELKFILPHGSKMGSSQNYHTFRFVSSVWAFDFAVVTVKW